MTQGTEDFMKPTLQDLLKQWTLASGQRTFVWESYNQCKRQQKESGGKAARLVLRTQRQSSWSLCQCCSDLFSNYKQKLNESPRSRPEDTTDFIETFDLSLGDLVAMNWEIYGDNRKMSELDKVLSHTAAKRTAAVSSCREVWPADRFWCDRVAGLGIFPNALGTRRSALGRAWIGMLDNIPSLDYSSCSPHGLARQVCTRQNRDLDRCVDATRLSPDSSDLLEPSLVRILNRSSSFDSPGLVYILSTDSTQFNLSTLLGLTCTPFGRSTFLGLHQWQLNAWSPQLNPSCFRTPTTPLSFSLASRPRYNLRPASAKSVSITPPKNVPRKKGEPAPKPVPVIHPSFTPAQVKARWAPLVRPEVQAVIPLLKEGAPARKSCAQLQVIFRDLERVMKSYREENDKGPIEIEAFLLSIWIAVRDAKRAYPEFPWKTTYPTLYSIVPPDRDRRAEIEPPCDTPSQAVTRPPPAKKPRYRSPSVAETPPPQASLSKRQLSPPAPVVERPKPRPIGRGAAVTVRGPPAQRSSSPESEEGVPLANIHAGDQASEIEAYVRHAHHTGYVPERFDEASEIYSNVIEKPRGGIPAPSAAVEKVSSVIVHDATIVPEGHVTFYVCTNCATRKQRCISRGLGKRCYSCNNGKMSCSLHSDIFQLLLAQERLRPMNNVGSISIVNVLQRVIAARRNADVHHYFLRNALLDFDDVVSDACILLEQQRQVLDFEDLVACFENPQDLQTVFTLFERLGIDYESSMDDLCARNPPPVVQGLSKDGDVVPGDAAEPETHFYVRGPTQQTSYGERDRFPPDSRKVEERIHKVPAGYDINAVGPPPDAVLEMRRQSKGKAPARPFFTPPAAQSSPQRAPPSSDPRIRPASPVRGSSLSHPEPSAQSSRKRQSDAFDSPTVQAPRRVSFQQQAASAFSNDNSEPVFRRPYASGSLTAFSHPSSTSTNVFSAPTTTDSGRKIPLTEQLAYAQYEEARRQGEARTQAAAQLYAPAPAPVEPPPSAVSSSGLPSFVSSAERAQWEEFMALRDKQVAQPAAAPTFQLPLPTPDTSFLTGPGDPELQDISFHDLDQQGDDSGAAIGDASVG
ncbi:hypothetical protein DFH06DRAFT_1135390 [Mycena polygramma]|nr:hypothetical protein DFH06DRAFT_1135390 [Mycena polygramma]